MSNHNHKTEQAVIYRIYTEDKDFRHELHDLINKQFDGYTLITGVGVYKGKREQALIVEIIGEYSDKSRVLRLAAEIKILGEQESVLVTTTTGLVNEIN